MDKYHLPKYIDEPPRLILWTIDEFMMFLIPFLILFLCFNSPFMAVLVGVVLVAGLKKIKGEEGHHFVYNLIYWYLPQMIKLKKTPASFIREMIG
jgi:conjugal transfer pilus assembly protein TraL